MGTCTMSTCAVAATSFSASFPYYSVRPPCVYFYLYYVQCDRYVKRKIHLMMASYGRNM
jgi:hypothetical protein